MPSARAAIIRSLRSQIQRLEARSHSADHAIAPFDFPLHRLLPDGRLPPGSLMELLSAAEGAGAWTMALLLARQTYGMDRVLVIIDGQGQFYPPAAVRMGIDLDRTIIIHATDRQDAHAAAATSLRCTRVGAVIGWCPQLTMPESRRLQLAAEAGGGYGFFLRPGTAQRMPSLAAVRWLLKPLPSKESCRRVHVEVFKCRGATLAQALVVEIDDETGRVRLPAEMADPKTITRRARVARPARRTG